MNKYLSQNLCGCRKSFSMQTALSNHASRKMEKDLG